MLELIAIEESSIPETRDCEAGNIAEVSPRVWKVLTGQSSNLVQTLVSIQNPHSEKNIICILRKSDESDGSHISSIRIGCVLFASLGLGSGIQNTVVVTVLKKDVQYASRISFLQIQSGHQFTDQTLAPAIDRLLRKPRIVSMGETISLPMWNCSSQNHTPTLSEVHAEPEDWIGPGRSIDTTGAFALLRISHIEASTRSCVPFGRVDSRTRVFVSRGGNHNSQSIPGIRRFLFDLPSNIKKPRACESLTNWITSKSRSGVLIGSLEDQYYQEVLEFSNTPIQIINCATKHGNLVDILRSPIRNSPSRLILILKNFDSMGRPDSSTMAFLNDSVQNRPELRVLIVVKSYQSVSDQSFIFDQLIWGGPNHGEPVIVDGYRELISKSGIVDQSSRLDQLTERFMPTSDAVSESEVNVPWSHIGGLDEAKRELKELLGSKLRRGILLFGPPGTGKTMLAKAVATELGSGSATFISVKGPEILSMYIGESEKNIREIFSRAKSSSKSSAVIFFDELDSIAPSRGVSRDSANVMDRVVASLLTEIDNLPESVFLIGATNRPDLLDPSLLRPGRIDRQVYVGIPEDKRSIVEAISCRNYRLDWSAETVSRVSQIFPRNMTGSDIAAVFKKAHALSVKQITDRLMLLSRVTSTPLDEIQTMMTRREDSSCKHVDVSDLTEEFSSCADCRQFLVRIIEDGEGVYRVIREVLGRAEISEKLLIDALSFIIPSVSESELVSYTKLRDKQATVM